MQLFYATHVCDLLMNGRSASIGSVLPDDLDQRTAALAGASSQSANQLRQSSAENATLGAVIRTLGASLDLDRVLASVVTLLSDASRCHGCFVYTIEGNRLVLRAASSQYKDLVDQLSIGIDEGLIGWVARSGVPEMIREAAMDDSRMKVIPELKEERFQSLVAAPIVGRDRSTIGVMSLHTVAPREFEPEVLDFLISSASLIGGAIENAQKHTATKLHVQKLKTLAAVTTAITACESESQLCATAVTGVRELFERASCQIYLAANSGLGGSSELKLAASELGPGGEDPAAVAAPLSETNSGPRSYPDEAAATLTIPLKITDEQDGLLVVSHDGMEAWKKEDHELIFAVANLVSAALERIALIDRLASQGSFAELVAAIEIGDLSVALTTAAALGIDLAAPHALLVVQFPVRESPRGVVNAVSLTSQRHRTALAELKTELAIVFPGGLSKLTDDGLTLLVPVADKTGEDELQGQLEKQALQFELTIGIGPIGRDLKSCMEGLTEARAAAKAASYLYPAGGVLSSRQLGPYRLLVRLDLEAVEEDRLFQAIEKIADYDLANNRRSDLLLTIERYLAGGRKVTASASVLFIHPNTLRQRLARIDLLCGLTLASEDQLELALALKLVRLKRGIPGDFAA